MKRQPEQSGKGAPQPSRGRALQAGTATEKASSSPVCPSAKWQLMAEHAGNLPEGTERAGGLMAGPGAWVPSAADLLGKPPSSSMPLNAFSGQTELLIGM